MFEKSPKIESKSKMSTKAPDDVELTVLSNCYLGFSRERFLIPQKWKTEIFIQLFPKSIISKEGTICCRTIP